MEEPKPEDFELTSDLIKKFKDIEKENGKPPYASGVQISATFFFLLVAGLSRDQTVQVYSLVSWALFAAIFCFFSKLIAKNRLNSIPVSYREFKSKNDDFVFKKDVCTRKEEK